MEWLAFAGAAVTAIASLIGVLYSNKSTRKLIVYRVEQLEKKVEIHNTLDRRLVAIETKLGMVSGGK
jgi:hypothetical protein